MLRSFNQKLNSLVLPIKSIASRAPEKRCGRNRMLLSNSPRGRESLQYSSCFDGWRTSRALRRRDCLKHRQRTFTSLLACVSALLYSRYSRFCADADVLLERREQCVPTYNVQRTQVGGRSKTRTAYCTVRYWYATGTVRPIRHPVLYVSTAEY